MMSSWPDPKSYTILLKPSTLSLFDEHFLQTPYIWCYQENGCRVIPTNWVKRWFPQLVQYLILLI